MLPILFAVGLSKKHWHGNDGSDAIASKSQWSGNRVMQEATKGESILFVDFCSCMSSLDDFTHCPLPCHWKLQYRCKAIVSIFTTLFVLLPLLADGGIRSGNW